MPEDMRKTRLSTRNHETRRPRSPIDNEESRTSVHVKAEDVLSGDAPPNLALVTQGDSSAHSQQGSTASEDTSESEEETPKNQKQKQKQEQEQEQEQRQRQPSSQFPYIPTYDELRRLQMFSQIQESMATRPVFTGHTYKKVTLDGNAVCIQGNAYDGHHLEAIFVSRRHNYEETIALSGSSLLTGDVTIPAMEAFVRQHKERTQQNTKDKNKSDLRGGGPL